MRRILVVTALLLLVWIPVKTVLASDSVDALLAGLNDGDWKVRRDAVIALGKQGTVNAAVLNGLQQALYDEDNNVRWAAVQGYVALGEAGVPALIEAVRNHSDASVKSWAVEGLGKLGTAAELAVPALIELVNGDDQGLRLSAVTVLGKIGSGAAAAVPDLALLLGGEFKEVMAAYTSLKQIDPEADLVSILLATLRSGTPDKAAKAALAIGGLGAKARSAVPALIELLRDSNPNLQLAAVKALGALGSQAKDAVPPLVQLSSGDDSVRVEIANALGSIKAEPQLALPVLTQLIFDPIPEVRRAALRAVKAFGQAAKEAAPLIAVCMGDENEVIRRIAQEVLAAVAPQANIVSLIAQVLAETDVKLRERAVMALSFVTDEPDAAVQLLIEALADEASTVKARAVLALGYHQAAAKAAVPSLVEAVKDRDLEVSWAAMISLSKIDPEIVPQLIGELGSDHLPILIEAVQDDQSSVRDMAAAILQEIAEEKGVVDLMAAMLREGEAVVKVRAIKVLHALGLETKGVLGSLVLALADRSAEVAKLAETSLLDLTGADSLIPALTRALRGPEAGVKEVASRLAQEQLAFYAQMNHDTMPTVIGTPAIIQPGDPLPKVSVWAIRDGVLRVRYVRNEAEVLEESMLNLAPGDEVELTLDEAQVQLGTYCFALEFIPTSGTPLYDAFYFTVQDPHLIPERSSRIAYLGPDGKMVYVPDYKGNRIPDFSYVGYMAGYAPIPDVPVKAVVEPIPGDNTAHIQAAINYVSSLPLDENGLRGAVLLKEGVYEIGGILKINASGVVLRGEGRGEVDLSSPIEPPGSPDEFKKKISNDRGTILLATGPATRSLIQVRGSGGMVKVPNSDQRILDLYVPVGARSFHVENAELFNVGDSIVVQRHGNAEWISYIGMDQIPPRNDGGTVTQWTPFTLEYDRVITAIDGNLITVDAPIMCAIEEQWGGGSIYKYTDFGRIFNVGVESMRAISIWSPDQHNKDHTKHADKFVHFDNAKNIWLRDVTGEHFFNDLVTTTRSCKWVTVENTTSIVAPNNPYYSDLQGVISGRVYLETGVYSGRSNYNLSSQLTLVRDVIAVNNRHAFCIQSRVAGPNVFHNCVAIGPDLGASEPHQRWSTGGLYDNVNDRISIINRGNMGSGHGWAGANYVVWNSVGSLAAQAPPTAQTWVIGHVGTVDRYQSNMGGPPAYKESWGEHVEPRSLYLQQLHERKNSRLEEGY